MNTIPDMTDKNIINIDFFEEKLNFSGIRSLKLTEIIYCQNTSNCYFYRNNSCLQCRIFNSLKCPYGHKVTVEENPRSKRFREWKQSLRTHPMYSVINNKLRNVYIRFGVINDYYYIDASDFTGLEQGKYVFEPGMKLSCEYRCQNKFFIKKEDCTVDFLHYLFSFNKMSERDENIISGIRAEIKSKIPDLYNNYCEEYPLDSHSVCYVSKTAYVKTLKPQCSIKTRNGIFTLSKDRKELSCDDYHDYFSSLPFNAETMKVKIDVTDKMEFVINDENIVSEDTILV